MRTTKYTNNSNPSQTPSTVSPAMQDVIYDIKNLDTRVADLEDGTISTDNLTVTNDANIGHDVIVGNDLTVTNTVTGENIHAGTRVVVTDNGTVADPALQIGQTGNGFYQVSPGQFGVSINNALATVFTANGIKPDAVLARVGHGAQELLTALKEYSDGRNVVAEITLQANFNLAIAGAANEAVGRQIYTLPAGAQNVQVSSMNVTLQGGGVVDADTPEVGVGSIVATGAVATLGGTADFEDYIKGVAAADCNGTATLAMEFPDAAINLNGAGGAKDVFLNLAGAWTGADTVDAAGSVIIIKYTIMS